VGIKVLGTGAFLVAELDDFHAMDSVLLK